MKNIERLIIGIGGAVICLTSLPSTVQAATVLGVRVNNEGSVYCGLYLNQCEGSLETNALIKINHTEEVVGQSTAFAQANEETGELKVSGTVTTSDTSAGTGASVASASITGQFTAQGSGEVTAYLRTTGSFYIYDFDDSGNDQALFSMTPSVAFSSNRLNSIQLFEETENFLVDDGWNSGDMVEDNEIIELSMSIDKWTIGSIAVTEGEVFSITAQFYAQILDGYGWYDFGDTAELLLTTSAGLTITPTSENASFLSNPSLQQSSLPGMATVPLPASLLLVLSGLLSLGLFRKTTA